MINKDIFGKRIYELRNKYGLSQHKLAQMLNVTYQAVSKWENGMGLPDIELIPLLAQVFGVSTDYLLCKSNEVSEVSMGGVQVLETFGNKSTIMSVLSNKLIKEDFYNLLRMMENGEADFRVNIEVISKNNGKTEISNKELSLEDFNIEALNCISIEIAQLAVGILNKRSNTIKSVIEKLMCPKCKGNLKYRESEDEIWLECDNGHKYMIIDGVVDFDTDEEIGNEWSKALRSYSGFKKDIEMIKDDNSERAQREDIIIRNQTERIKKIKPKYLIEIACGRGIFVQRLIREINWPCIIILTDISHRILRYLKRYLEETLFNPVVKIIYLGCDARNLPIQSNSIDCVTSFRGYESIMSDDLEAVNESYRILKNQGYCIYSMRIVDDVKSQIVNGWVQLYKKTLDQTFPLIEHKIRSIDDWCKINEKTGFRDFKIDKLVEEYPSPKVDKSPYDYEIMRWMGEAVIFAVK